MRGQEPLATVGTGPDHRLPAARRWSLLRASSTFSTPEAAGLEGSEAQNVVVKTLPVLGDLGAVAFLLVAFRRRPGARARTGRRLLGGAAFLAQQRRAWAISTATYAPLAAAALWMAGRGRAGLGRSPARARPGLVKATRSWSRPRRRWRSGRRGAPLRGRARGSRRGGGRAVPFVVASTAPLAVAQVFRIIFQKTFSGGFANPWWLAGHAVSVAGGSDWTAPVRFVRQEAVGLPVAPVGLALFALAMAGVLRAQRTVAGTARGRAWPARPLVFAYGMLALGVHENHPHAMSCCWSPAASPRAACSSLRRGGRLVHR